MRFNHSRIRAEMSSGKRLQIKNAADYPDKSLGVKAGSLINKTSPLTISTPFSWQPVGGSIRNTYVFQGKTPTGATAYATMVTGAVSYDVPFTSNGTSQVLADFKKLWAPRLYATTCYAGDKTWLANNQQTILGFTRAWIRAGNFITNPANRPAVVQLIATNNQIRPEVKSSLLLLLLTYLRICGASMEAALLTNPLKREVCKSFLPSRGTLKVTWNDTPS